MEMQFAEKALPEFDHFILAAKIVVIQKATDRVTNTVASYRSTQMGIIIKELII